MNGSEKHHGFEVSHFPRFTLELKLSFNELKIINKSFKNLLFVIYYFLIIKWFCIFFIENVEYKEKRKEENKYSFFPIQLWILFVLLK